MRLLSGKLLVLIAFAGSQTIQVCLFLRSNPVAYDASAEHNNRMLENPTDENVVRWGNESDSFVVLEVGALQRRD